MQYKTSISPIIDRLVAGSLRVVLDVGGKLSPEGRPVESVGPIAHRQRPFVAWGARIGRVLLWQFVVRPRDRRGFLRPVPIRQSEAGSAGIRVQHWFLVAGP